MSGNGHRFEWQNLLPGLATGHAIVETWRACR